MRERRRRGWSREYVADKVKVTPYTVGQWERGEQLPYPDSLQKLCELFGKTPEELGLIPAGFLSSDQPTEQPSSSSIVPSPDQRKNTFWESFRSRKKFVIGSFLVTVIVIGGLILFLISASFRPLPVQLKLTQAQIIATTAAKSPEDLYKLVTSESAAFKDSLRDQDANSWDKYTATSGGCKFAEGAYLSYVLRPYVAECYAQAKWFPLTPIFALQVKMTFSRGDGGGGLIFGYRGANLRYYRFLLRLDGYFDLFDPWTQRQLPYGTNPAFKSDPGQYKQLTVIVCNSIIYLYINDIYMGQASMEANTSVAGKIGLFSVEGQQNPTEDVFHDMKVWIIIR